MGFQVQVEETRAPLADHRDLLPLLGDPEKVSVALPAPGAAERNALTENALLLVAMHTTEVCTDPCAG